MSDASDPPLTPEDRLNDFPRILRALRQAVGEALQRHKRAGRPVAVWRDNKVVWIQPEDIPEWSGPEEED